MARASQHLPGEAAAVSGLYREVNVFGTPTGIVVKVPRGEKLPHAPRGFSWLLLEELPDEPDSP